VGEPNPFEQVTQARVRPDFRIEPLSIAWDAVAFRVTGTRDGVVCVPRCELAGFFEALDAGRLDDTVRGFLAAPPSGRILRAADQTRTSGLFDGIASPDAIVPPERVPGRAGPLGIGRGGGTPADARQRKRERRPRAPRSVVVGAVVAGVVVAAVVAVASRGGGDSKTAAVNTTVVATTATSPPDVVLASALAGTWTVTRTVTSSTNGRQPVGQALQLNYVITSSCLVSPCTVHVDAEGSQGAREQIDLTFVGDHYEGAVSGTAPCRSFTTGELLGETTLTGSLSLRLVQPHAFTGSLTLNLQPNANCAASTIDYSLVATN
jgi:hypothetical protein